MEKDFMKFKTAYDRVDRKKIQKNTSKKKQSKVSKNRKKKKDESEQKK